MSLFSFFRKDKQESPDDRASYSRAKDEPNPKRTRARRNSASDDAAADQVLPEKKRARRRLVGAVALVLAAVIGLPMVLDSEPKPLAQDIDINIPSKDHPAQPRRVPPAASLDPAEQILEPVDGVVEPGPSAKSPRQHETAADAGKPVSKPEALLVDAADRKAAALPTATPKVAAVEPKATEPKAAEPKAVEPKAAEPKAAEPKATEPKATESKATESKAAAAKAIARAEAKEGGKPDAHAGARGEPADEDKEAARAKAILEGKGAAAAGKAQADTKPAKYMLQVAALASQDKITELRNKLKAAGIASQTQKIPTASGERTRVRVGPFASKEEAEKTRAKLVKLGLNGSLVPLGE